MLELFSILLTSNGFEPHGYCFLWTQPLLLLYVVSDTLIALSYYSIPIALLYFVRRRKDLAFNWMFLMFGAFIFACGTTHIMSLLVIWEPLYWLDGVVKAITAGLSVPTAIAIWPLIPKALALPSPAQLETANRDLEKQIAERKEAEEEIKGLNEDLTLRAVELEATNKELESFSYSVSHDLRAPLRGVDGFSQALLEDYAGKLDAKGQSYLQRVRGAAQYMAQLIDDLLQLSRVTRSELSRVRIDLSAMARAVATELQKSQPERQAQFVIAEGLVADGDQRLLRLALENLLGNAWKFTSKRPRATIEFGVVERNGKPTYFVRDNGAGFDMAYADNLFGPFQRLHTPDEFPGTGIGLATVQRLVHRHGGSVWAEAKVDRGATFYFTLN